MLAFKRIPFEEVYVPYHDKRDLLKVTGQDYVPSLTWGPTFVPWYDIPTFLEQQVPQPTLYPMGMGGAAKVIEHWGHEVLEERVWRAVVTEVPPVLKSDHERWVFEEMQTRARGPWHVLQSRKGEFEKDVEKHLQMVEEMLDGKPWILGEPSVADFGVYGGMSPLFTIGRKLPSSMKATRAWAARIEAL
jgi:glutathione S-transferase